ncbi:type II toxin-antitoxin system death-on-curing family toxin [Phycisphaeraceae bacterium D3-23]
METIRFVTTDIALALHQDQIDCYGGDAGLRDVGLLESALAMPCAMFGGQYVHEDLPAMAGAYLFHLAKNHAFVDGNKRVAFAVTLYFLDDHGYTLDFSHAEAEQFVLSIASSALSKDQATAMLREHLVAV